MLVIPARATDSECTAMQWLRKYLIPPDVEPLKTHARRNSRNPPQGRRDTNMIFLTYPHGIRCSESVGAGMGSGGARSRPTQRAKNGTPSVHPIRGAPGRQTRPIVDLNGISQPVRCVAWRLRWTLTENRRLGYSLRRAHIHVSATEKGISHGATATCISA